MSGAAPEGKFQDHYLVLAVAPKATMEEIHQAYQAFVKVCHPVTGTAPDPEKFKDANAAYEVLSDPATRRMFDEIRPDPNKDAAPEFESDAFFNALRTEQDRRMTILCLLYDRRRFKPVIGSLSQRHLEQMVAFSTEQLTLAIFYLQKRGYVEMNDKSSYLITVDGMDYLEKSPPSPEFVRAMLNQTKKEEPAPPAVAEVPAAAPVPAPDPPSQLAALNTALHKESKPAAPAKPAPVPAAAGATPANPAANPAAKPAPPALKYRFGNRRES